MAKLDFHSYPSKSHPCLGPNKGHFVDSIIRGLALGNSNRFWCPNYNYQLTNPLVLNTRKVWDLETSKSGNLFFSSRGISESS